MSEATDAGQTVNHGNEPGRPSIRVTGRGPDLVLVHGWGMHAGIWGDMAERLTSAYTLHLVDLPGHGRAAVPPAANGQGGMWSLAGVVDTLLASVPPAVWLGWSLGGQVALEAARRAPERVRGLALISATPRFVAAPDWPAGMPESTFAAFADACAEEPAATLKRFTALQARGEDDVTGSLRELRRRASAAPTPVPASLVSGLGVLRKTDLRSALPAVGQPALWIGGVGDAVTPAAAGRAAAAAMPDGRFTALAGAGHAPFVSHPGQVMAGLSPFLDQITAAAADRSPALARESGA